MVSAATAPDLIFNPPTGGIAYYRSFAADTDSISIINELRGFLRIENYNGLELQLSPPAYAKAESYLEAASSTIRLSKLRPEFTPDGDGGIEIEWERNGRRLVVSFKAHPGDRDFISWREPQGRYDGREATKELLQDRLNWLLG